MNKTLIIQIVVILTIVLGYFFIDFNKLYNSLRGEVKYSVQSSNCDLHKTACEVITTDGTKFELEVFPKNIPLMQTLTFKLKSTNQNLNNPKISIYATNMFMGQFDLQFKNMGNGLYEAQGILPTCPIGNMQWNADIEINKINERIGARFQFETKR